MPGDDSSELLSVGDDWRLIYDSAPSCESLESFPPISYFNSTPQVMAGGMGANYLKCLSALCQPLTVAAEALQRTGDCCCPLLTNSAPLSHLHRKMLLFDHETNRDFFFFCYVCWRTGVILFILSVSRNFRRFSSFCKGLNLHVLLAETFLFKETYRIIIIFLNSVLDVW